MNIKTLMRMSSYFLSTLPENGKERQEKGKERAKTIRQQIKNCCLIVRG